MSFQVNRGQKSVTGHNPRFTAYGRLWRDQRGLKVTNVGLSGLTRCQQVSMTPNVIQGHVRSYKVMREDNAYYTRLRTLTHLTCTKPCQKVKNGHIRSTEVKKVHCVHGLLLKTTYRAKKLLLVLDALC